MRILWIFCLLLVNRITLADAPYVTVCSIQGQFGAQLFSVAMLYGLAWENNLEPVLFKEVFLKAPGGLHNYTRFFSRFCNQPSNQSIGSASHIQHQALYPYQYTAGNICICGLRTELWYFQNYRNEIRELFAPPDEILHDLEKRYSSLIKDPKTVAVHVRTYHPYFCPEHAFLGVNYYKNAMDKFPDDYKFVIFSDRIGWCKAMLLGHKKHMVFIEGNDYIADFFLMTLCKNIITANSTYSWWAAFLRRDETGRVLVPSQWFYDSYNRAGNDVLDRGLYLPEWEVIPVTYLPPPNKELLKYKTTSIDENK